MFISKSILKTSTKSSGITKDSINTSKNSGTIAVNLDISHRRLNPLRQKTLQSILANAK